MDLIDIPKLQAAGCAIGDHLAAKLTDAVLPAAAARLAQLRDEMLADLDGWKIELQRPGRP